MREPRHSNDLRARLLSGLPLSERRLRLAGVETAVLEGGDGAPVVLLHGPGEFAAKWLRIFPSLVRTHRVIAPDLPGHGASKGVLEAEQVLDWLGELIDLTCPEPPVVVGQILGGAIAARFAAQRGDRIRTLVLVDALGLGPFRPAPEFGQALSEFIVQPNEKTHDALWRRCAFDLNTLRDGLGERWETLKAYNLDRARALGQSDTQRHLMEHFGLPPIPEEDLARIPVPTILVWGRHDLATPLEVAETVSFRYGWPLHVIEDAADDPPIEQPEAFLQVLREAIGGEETRDSQEAWNRIAGGYDELVTPSHFELAEEGLSRVGLRPGMKFLDVACGSGALSIPAARLGAEVMAVDLSPAMLERLVGRASARGLSVETRVMDGHALELEDDTFDVSGSQWGVMLFEDFSLGLRELVRVTKPGGRVLLHALGAPQKTEFLTFFVAAMKAVVPGFEGIPTNPPPLPFQVSDPAELRREFARAGLEQVELETVTESLHFESGRALWDWLMNSNPIPGMMVSDLSQEQKERVIDELEASIRERAAGHGRARLTNPAHIAIGTKAVTVGREASATMAARSVS